MLKPARRNRSMVAFSRLPLGIPSLSFMSVPVDARGIVGARFGFFPLSVVEPPEEAAFIAFVADARAESFDFDEQRVAIAVGGNFLDHQTMAGGLSFHPQLVARAAEEGDETRFHGFAERFVVHEAHHENATGLVVLDDSRQKAVEF